MHAMGGWHSGFGHWVINIVIWIVVFAVVLALFKVLSKDD
jgi:uncharacterized membrane protein